MSDVDGGTVSTRPDGLAGAPDLSQPHGGDGLPPIPVRRPDRARRVRYFVALLTGYATFFIWITVVFRQRIGRDPPLVSRISAMETVGRLMFYVLTLILWVGSVALWRTSRLGVEKSSRHAPTVAMYIGGSVGIVLGLLFAGLDPIPLK
jgi:amino acid transporter